MSGLTDGTDYQFKVRAVNATGNGAESDASTAVQPKAVALAASSVEAATATLTISNHAGSWYYEANAAPDASCSSSAVTGATEDLTGLSSNTSYTYKAYSDSGCSTELASASAFLTKPGKPTTPTAAVGAGSGKLTITSSVTGGGTLSRWEYKKKEGTGNFDSDWTTISSTSTSLSHTVSGLTDGTDYQFKVRAVNATGNGAESDASTAVQPKAVGAGREFGRSRDRHADDLEPCGKLVLRGERRAGRVLLVQRGDGSDRGPDGPVVEHELHLQGVQRQRLLDGTGERLRVPDQAGQADDAHRGRGRGQRQADHHVVGDRQRHAEPLGIQEEGGHGATSIRTGQRSPPPRHH